MRLCVCAFVCVFMKQLCHQCELRFNSASPPTASRWQSCDRRVSPVLWSSAWQRGSGQDQAWDGRCVHRHPRVAHTEVLGKMEEGCPKALLKSPFPLFHSCVFPLILPVNIYKGPAAVVFRIQGHRIHCGVCANAASQALSTCVLIQHG